MLSKEGTREYYMLYDDGLGHNSIMTDIIKRQRVHFKLSFNVRTSEIIYKQVMLSTSI